MEPAQTFGKCLKNQRCLSKVRSSPSLRPTQILNLNYITPPACFDLNDLFISLWFWKVLGEIRSTGYSSQDYKNTFDRHKVCSNIQPYLQAESCHFSKQPRHSERPNVSDHKRFAITPQQQSVITPSRDLHIPETNKISMASDGAQRDTSFQSWGQNTQFSTPNLNSQYLSDHPVVHVNVTSYWYAWRNTSLSYPCKKNFGWQE